MLGRWLSLIKLAIFSHQLLVVVLFVPGFTVIICTVDA